jgi:hypothetical protein
MPQRNDCRIALAKLQPAHVGTIDAPALPPHPPCPSTPLPPLQRRVPNCKDQRELPITSAPVSRPLCVCVVWDGGRQTSSGPRLEDEHMAHFYGILSGRGRTTASRVGRKTTGLQTVAASWQGAVKVSLYAPNGVDHAVVELTEWRGASTNRILYDGPVAGVALTRDQSSPDGHCFHIASIAPVHGSRTNTWQMKCEGGLWDSGAPGEIRTHDLCLRRQRSRARCNVTAPFLYCGLFSVKDGAPRSMKSRRFSAKTFA